MAVIHWSRSWTCDAGRASVVPTGCVRPALQPRGQCDVSTNDLSFIAIRIASRAAGQGPMRSLSSEGNAGTGLATDCAQGVGNIGFVQPSHEPSSIHPARLLHLSVATLRQSREALPVAPRSVGSADQCGGPLPLLWVGEFRQTRLFLVGIHPTRLPVTPTEFTEQDLYRLQRG